MKPFKWIKAKIENVIGFFIGVLGVIFFMCFGLPEEKDYKDDK